MRSFRYVIADVFTDVPLAGNQLAVFTDARDLDDVTMQALALEVGFSETVYVLPPREAVADGGGHARIRIFTPAQELPFAGHPTLGTAFVLGAPLQLGVISLETAAAEGILFLAPEPRSPHGVDVAPKGDYISVAGKLDPHVTVYSIDLIKKAIAAKTFEGKDRYGVPILKFDAVVAGRMENPGGPLAPLR